MTRTEDRLADALQAAARTVPEESLHPLVVPERHVRGRRRPGWLAPAAAAMGVILVIGLAVLASRLSGGPARPAVGLPPGVPRYYVEAGLVLGPGRPVIRSTATGAVTGTVPVPKVANPRFYAVVSAPDANGTFFIAAYSPADRSERLYRFRLTRSGQVTGFAALPGGPLGAVQWAASTLAVSPDGSRIAVGMTWTGPIWTCGRACRQPRSDYLMVISTTTGARTVWRNQAGAPHPWFYVDSLSWTSGHQELAVLGEWCPQATMSEGCTGRGRVAEVRALDPASGGGAVYSGRLLLRESARFPYLMQALISPDGATITALLLRGRQVGGMPEDLSLERIATATGQPLAVLYRHHLDGNADFNLSPHFLALSQDGSGQYLMLDIGLCGGTCAGGANGWIHAGRLVPLRPADGREADEAW